MMTVRGVGGLPVASITPSASGSATVAAYYHHDVMGSTVAATEPGVPGAAMVFNYSDFGVPGAGSGLAYTYAGYRYDTETGLYYVHARYYNPNLGRFLQTDPIGLKGGTNLYAYVGNDPINGIDPTGLICAVPDQGAQGQSASPTYLILVGQSGQGDHDVGSAFQLAAQQYASELQSQGAVPIIVNVGTIQDVASALNNNGYISGGVSYFGHIAAVNDPSGGMTWGLAVGSGAGADTNVGAYNVGALSGANLGPNASIFLNGCNGATDSATLQNGQYLSDTPIAQTISNQLNRGVYAYDTGMFFSNNPQATSSMNAGMISSAQPVFMIPEGGFNYSYPLAFTPQH
jgi:RHS repeat-associated protein